MATTRAKVGPSTNTRSRSSASRAPSSSGASSATAKNTFFHSTRRKGLSPCYSKTRSSSFPGSARASGVKLAVEAAREGARGVAIGARTAEKLDDAEKRMSEANAACKVLKVVTDIRDAAQCKRLAEAANKEFGRIDGLANSAFFWGTPGTGGWLRSQRLEGDPRDQRHRHDAHDAGGGAVHEGAGRRCDRQHQLDGQRSSRTPGRPAMRPPRARSTSRASTSRLELGASNIRVNVARMGWMLGVPVQNFVTYAAKEQGVPEKQFYDAVVGQHRPAAPGDRHRVRARGAVPAVGLCLGRYRGGAGRERRRNLPT